MYLKYLICVLLVIYVNCYFLVLDYVELECYYKSYKIKYLMNIDIWFFCIVLYGLILNGWCLLVIVYV